MPAKRLSWLRDRKKVASGLVVALVVGTIAALSLTYDGVATADVELNDGGVWVSNEQSVLVGRLNVPVREIDATFAADTPDIDLRQREDQVLLHDASNGVLRTVDTANAQLSGAAVTVAADAHVAMGEGAVGVMDPADGRLWVTEPSRIGDVEDTTVEPTAVLGEGALLAVGDDGTAVALDVLDNELVTMSAQYWQLDPEREPSQDDPTAEVVPLVADGTDLTTGDVQLALVGDAPVVLVWSETDARLTLQRPDTEPVDLSGLDIDHASARLQETSASGDRVALATSDAVVTVPLDGGEPRVEPTQRPGPPVQPVQVAGCVHGAWAGEVPSHVRICGDNDPLEQEVPDAAAGAEMVFRHNRDYVVLNQLDNGNVWMIEDRLYLVDNWIDAIAPSAQEEETENPSEQETDEVPLDRDAENRPPTANPDEFGVRSDRTIVLPVLANDRDPDGDLLTVESATQPPESFGRIETIMDGRALQIRVAPDASGSAQVEYGISDGRGGEDTATISLTVYPAAANQPPERVNGITPEVVSGGTVEFNIVNDVIDPEGDEVSFVGASGPDTVNVDVRPDGMVTVTDLGVTTGQKAIVVDAQDDRGAVSEIRVDLTVLPDGTAAPTAVFDFASGFAGSDIEVAPLANDIDPGNSPLDLSIVTTTTGGTQRTDHDADTFVFSAQSPGVHYLTYVVTNDDGLTDEGLVRVDVLPETDAPPVAVRDIALLPPQGSVAVDVLDNDTDPSGGVLAVQSVDIPDGSGVQVAILDHRILRFSADRVLTAPVTVGYTVSNGSASASGEVLVMPLPAQSTAVRPVAEPDTARVRVGDYVSVPVLANDTHPAGLEFQLTGIEVPDGTPGLPFVAGDLLRYAAPSEPGVVEITYEITDAAGQTDSAILTIYVEARDDAANAPPEPDDIEVRAFVGERIRIPIGLYGVDPDGDSVTLVGPTTSPALGRVVQTGGGYIDYVAYNDAGGGTDSFEFTVRDRGGALGTATVTIGVVPAPSTNRSPVATADVITVRPDRSLQVDVLLNDTDPDGDQLTFADPAIVSAPEGVEVTVEDGLLRLDSPSEPGDYTIQYQIDDSRGGLAIGALTVTVDPDADPLPPIAVDDMVPASTLLGAETVDVDVVENDYDPDGSQDDLVVSLPDGTPEGITVLDERTLQIPVSPTRQVLTYRLTDLDGEATYAFVEVPGTEDTGPVLDPDAETLQVDSGAELIIGLDEHVVSLDGAPVQLYDFESVTATNADGGPYAIDGQTLRFVSAPDYSGPATLTFEVTSAPDINADGILTSVLTLDIEVLPTSARPPEFSNGSLDLEAGGDSATLNLSRLVSDPDTELSDLTLELGEVPPGFEATLSDNVILTASAARDTARGTSLDLPVLVSDGDNDPVEGVVTLTATASSAPLAVPNDDSLGEIEQGEQQRIAVLANDVNPFPDTPLEVIDAAAVTGTASVDIVGGDLLITPGEDYVGPLSVRYTVRDATGDPLRDAEAVVTGAVLGVPGTPARPAIGSEGDSEVVVDIAQPVDNGSPITGYEITASDGTITDCATTTCRITGLTNDVTYTFTVVAINDVGRSDPSAASAQARPDVSPGPVSSPDVTYGDGELALTWSPPVNEGSDLTDFDIQIQPGAGASTQVRVDGSASGYTWTGLENGVTYQFRLRAHNAHPEPGEWGGWSSPEYPSGPPLQPAAPTLTRIDTPEGGQVRATWMAPDDNGDAIAQYHLTLYRDGSVYREVSVGGGETSRLFEVENASDYTLSVVAENRSGESEVSAQSASVRTFGKPGRVPSVGASPTGSDGQATVTFETPADNGQPISRYEYRVGGQAGTISSGQDLNGLADGQRYTMQVRACNTYCGDWSPPSAQFSTYGPPGQPSGGQISSSANGRDVTFRWNYPDSNNGASITAAQIRADGGQARGVDVNGSLTIGGDWEQNHSLQFRVQNEHGQWSGWSQQHNRRAEADPTPPVSITPVSGDSIPCERGSGTCWNVSFRYENLPPVSGGYTVSFTTSGNGACGSFSQPPRNAQISNNGTYQSTRHYGMACAGATIVWTITGGGQTYRESGPWQP